MDYHIKLKKYFTNTGLKQGEIAQKLGYTDGMFSRYLNKTAPNWEFIEAVSKEFKDIDWNYLIKDSELEVNEEEIVYVKNPKRLIKEIEVRLSELKVWHENDTDKD